MEAASFPQTPNRRQSPIKPAVSHTHVTLTDRYTAAFQSIHTLTRTKSCWRLILKWVRSPKLCWMHFPSVGNPINLQEELFHGAILSSHLNIYSQSADYLCLTLSDFFFDLCPCTLSPFHSFIRPLPIFIISLACLICCSLLWIDLLSSPLHVAGGFSETYAALCDYNGIGCKEEVQWVRTMYKNTSVCFSNVLLFFSLCTRKKNPGIFYITVPYLSSFLLLLVSFCLICLHSSSVPGCRHHLPLAGQQGVQLNGFQPS